MTRSRTRTSGTDTKAGESEQISDEERYLRYALTPIERESDPVLDARLNSGPSLGVPGADADSGAEKLREAAPVVTLASDNPSDGAGADPDPGQSLVWLQMGRVAL